MRLLSDALRDLRAHRMRSFLASVGLFLALVSLVGATALSAVVREAFVAQDEQRHGRLPTLVSTMDLGILTADRLTETLDVLHTVVGDVGGRFALVHDSPLQISTDQPGIHTRYQNSQVRLVAGNLNEVRRLPMLSGQWLSPDDQVYPGGVVLNVAARERFGAIGDVLTIRHHERIPAYPQPVVGVVSDGIDHPIVYQSMSSAIWRQPTLADTGFTPELLVHIAGGNDAEITRAVEAAAAALDVRPESLHTFARGNLRELLGNLEFMRVAFAAVSSVMLVVAVVGLLNIGLATLRERTRELSLRRAVGATRFRIVCLILTSTLLLSSAVGVATIASSYVAVRWSTPLWLDPATALNAPAYPVWSAAVAMAAAMLAGVAGGVAPAIAAARVNMVQVLRE